MSHSIYVPLSSFLTLVGMDLEQPTTVTTDLAQLTFAGKEASSDKIVPNLAVSYYFFSLQREIPEAQKRG